MVFLAEKTDAKAQPVRLDGLEFLNGLKVSGNSQVDFQLEGAWHKFGAEAGIGNSSAKDGTVRFQVWGDDRLLWDSGTVSPGTIIKPKLDIRGLSNLSLRTITTDPELKMIWAEATVTGFVGNTVQSVN